MSLTLSPITNAYLFIPLPLEGTDTEGATQLNYSLDGGPWQQVWQFSPGGAWTGVGPRIPLTATPQMHTIQVQNPANSNVSNIVSFETASFIPPTFIVNDDDPNPGTLGVTTGAGGSVLALPPNYPSGNLSCPVAGTISVTNYSQYDYSSYTDTEVYTDGTADSGLLLFGASGNGSGMQRVFVDYYSSGSGPQTLYLVANVPATFSTRYLPCFVAAEGGANRIFYVGSTSINGTFAYGGLFFGNNVGNIGPAYFNTGGGGAGFVSITPQFSAPDAYSLTLNTHAPVSPSTTVTLTGTNTCALLATGMDYNLDFSNNGSLTPQTSLVYQRVSSFTGASTQGGTWTATIPGLSAGTHLITVRDHNLPMLESNTITLQVLGAANLRVSQVVEQVWMAAPRANLRVSQVVEQVWMQLVPNGRIGLYQTDVLPSSTDTYIEFGDQMSWDYETALLPDNQHNRNNSMIVTTLDMAFIGNTPVVSVEFTDSGGNQLGAAAIQPNGALSIWDVSKWDQAPWDGVALPLSPYQIPWTQPIVFKQGQFSASGLSFAGFKIGTLYMEYSILGYVSQQQSGRV